jgi:hypothetical protein
MKGSKMGIRTGLGLLACCCAGLAACTASAPRGPDTTVSTLSVGRPPPPSSVQAALSREAFTPYAALGQSNNDGLAPNESGAAISDACMNAAGYPGSGLAPIDINLGTVALAFSQPWGGWGYLGVAEAEQYGFRVPPGAALSALGIDAPQLDTNPASLPQAEQTAIGKCGTIFSDFTHAAETGPLAGVEAMSNDIVSDVGRDAAVKAATDAWAACMAKNGYSYRQPQTVFFQERKTMYAPNEPVNPDQPVSTAANQAQIAAAASDANCTQSTDLAGIYFAVQASYEQQFVNANAQALAAAVRQYRAAYAKELNKLPALLKTATAVPVSTGKPARAGSS